jgi:hypothetical protein
MEMFEESLKSIQEGKIVSGEIVQIDNEFVLVDIGYKSEGQIRINEFKDLEGNLNGTGGGHGGSPPGAQGRQRRQHRFVQRKGCAGQNLG